MVAPNHHDSQVVPLVANLSPLGIGAFLKQFLAHPFQVGAVLPSSRALSREMLHGLDFSKIKTVVEYGPGTGAFSQYIDQKLAPGARFIAVEPNADFQKILTAKFPHMTLIGDYADALPRYFPDSSIDADLVISGLPFSLMPEPVIFSTIETTHKIMKDGAEFRTFLYFQSFYMGKIKRLMADLHQKFSEVRLVSVLPNVPPAKVVICKK